MKILGLDLGVKSVGWALREQDSRKVGVYVFPEADEREKGVFESHRRKRGEKRRQRRNLRRKRNRRNRLVKLLVAHGMLPAEKNEREDFLCSIANPYALRKKGLDEELTPYEFGRCLYHLCRRRGYLNIAELKVKELGMTPNEEVPEIESEEEGLVSEKEKQKKKEEGEMLSRISQVWEMLKKGEARTIGELYADLIAKGGEVGKDGKRMWIRGKAYKPKIAREKAAERSKFFWEQNPPEIENQKSIYEMMHKEILKKKNEEDEDDEISKEDFNKLFKKVIASQFKNEDDKKDYKRRLSDAIFPPQTRDTLGFRLDRRMLEEEFEKLWNKQAQFKPNLLTNDLKKQTYEIIFKQQPLRNQKFLVGKCHFFTKRNRAPRALPLSQRFSIVQTLVNMTLVDKNGEKRRLEPEEIQKLADELQRRDELSWKDAKAIIGQTNEAYFLDEPQGNGAKQKKTKSKNKSGRVKEKLVGDKTAKVMRKALGDKWDSLNEDKKSDLVTRLLTCREFKNIVKGLKHDFKLDDNHILSLASANLPSGYMNLSVKAMKILLPYMENGYVYSEACEKAGLKEQTPKANLDKLPYVTNINNPIVERAVNAAIDVINAVIKKHGKPDRIRIEMPRDVSRTNKQRIEMWNEQDKRAEEREKAEELLKDNQLAINEKNIKKVRLWQEAGCCSPYEPGKVVSLKELIDDYDIDHIVPRSRCYENGWHNLTICPNNLNQYKADKTPFEAWGNDSEKWRNIKTHMMGLKSMLKSKRERILRENWEDIDFNDRALTDTRYISKLVKSQVEKLGVKVEVSRGQITAMLRNIWEINTILPPSPEEKEEMEKYLKSPKGKEKPRFDHRHHALDALITSLTDTSTLQALTKYYKQIESGKPKKETPKELPWSTFVEDVKKLIEECPIVYKPTRGISGPLHEETARKPPPQDEVEKAIATLPDEQRKRIKKCVVVGTQLVCLDDTGKAYKAYNLGSNHHCVIWENNQGERDITVVPMIEASRRAAMKEPVFQSKREGWNCVMCLCNNDIVEWKGEKKQKGLWRVSALYQNRKTNQFEITLSPLKNARKVKDDDIRVCSRKDLKDITRRVILDAIGNEIASEPSKK